MYSYFELDNGYDIKMNEVGEDKDRADILNLKLRRLSKKTKLPMAQTIL